MLDGNYYIDPDWGWWTPAIKVYCDMTTNWWGWTRYLKISWKYTKESAKACWLNSTWGTAYWGLPECFNPNRYSITASTMRIKIFLDDHLCRQKHMLIVVEIHKVGNVYDIQNIWL